MDGINPSPADRQTLHDVGHPQVRIEVPSQHAEVLVESATSLLIGSCQDIGVADPEDGAAIDDAVDRVTGLHSLVRGLRAGSITVTPATVRAVDELLDYESGAPSGDDAIAALRELRRVALSATEAEDPR